MRDAGIEDEECQVLDDYVTLREKLPVRANQLAIPLER